ncbi:MAG: hypothetical protein GY796_20370 [Chloroflexi bacterium]|nr:hypothetical protein [Chloroflexota bacterium]
MDGPFEIFGKRGISYSARVPLEAVRDFYQEALIAQGWEWVYTDIGQGLSPTGLTPILAQEFKRGEYRLAVVAIDNFNFFTPENPPSVLILSAQDTSSGEIMFFFSSLMAEATAHVKPKTEDINLSRMEFTSDLIRFEHPGSWIPTRTQMITFPTDTGEKKINILQKRCANDNEVCFVNFMLFGGNTQYQAPVSIRVYPVQAETTLENFDALRWTELTNTMEDPLAIPEQIEWPEDLTDSDSLETIEIKSITLQDDTPSLQHTYRWQQVDLSTPLVSSYTLFKYNENTIIEFHTDFTKEEWTIFGPTVQESILSIEIVR